MLSAIYVTTFCHVMTCVGTEKLNYSGQIFYLSLCMNEEPGPLLWGWIIDWEFVILSYVENLDWIIPSNDTVIS
jgi:hypothetical protein